MPLEELRYACGVSRDGSKASNLLRAARTLPPRRQGLEVQATVEKLRGSSLPAILFWNSNHFVVLEGFDERGAAYINDPALGPRLVSAAELD